MYIFFFGIRFLELDLLFLLLLNLFLPLLLKKYIYLFYVFAPLFLLVLVFWLSNNILSFFFIFCFDILFIKQYKKRCIQFHVLILNIILKQFLIEFWINCRKCSSLEPTIKFKPSYRPFIPTFKLIWTLTLDYRSK